jgi:prepilin-type N-terminal cleavage/methylation domain-containing protein
MSIRQRRRSRRSGFTLIELAAVLFIMAILAVLAVGFTGAVNDRVDRANVEQLLDSVIGAQQEHALKEGTWAKGDDELQIGRSAIIVEGTSSSPGEVSMAVDGVTVILATIARDGTCLAKRLGDPLLDGTPMQIEVSPGTPCSAGILLGVRP